MSALLILAAVCCALALVPAVLGALNLIRFRPPPRLSVAPVTTDEETPRISVLIPARNEEAHIEAAVRSVLAARGVDLEVVVLDDGSTDRTAEIVRSLAAEDDRVRLHAAPALPEGWCGKSHACAVLADLAENPLLVFLDADVRLTPEAPARLAAFRRASGAALVSGFPHQVTGTWLEKLLIPLIHYVLLGFLPMGRMRSTTRPAYAAANGQWLAADRDAYRAVGGHRSIAGFLHDGLQLCRRFRAHGYRTDVFDAVDLARCRMYTRAGEVWEGLAKNATEGLAAPKTLVPMTLLLGLGQIVPPVLWVWAWWTAAPSTVTALAGGATVLGVLPRVLMATRFGHSWLGVALHPLAVALLLAIQWQAYGRSKLGRPATWKGRAYPARTAPAGPTEASEAGGVGERAG